MKRILLFFALLVALAGVATGVLYYQGRGKAPDPRAVATAEPSEAVAAGSLDDEDSDAPVAVPVSVADVTRGAVSTYLSATANLVAEDEVQVLAEAEGRVTNLLVEEGDRVSQGQLLATLLRDEAEIRHHKARLKATNADLAFRRTERMLADDLVARDEFDRVTMEHRIAQQELAEAKWALDKTEIRAPFDGRITSRGVTLGQHVRPGEELFVVTSFDPLVSRIYLPERDVLGLDAGREVKITLRADENVSFRGRIRQISPVVDTATGTVKVTIEAVRPPRNVRPGGFVLIEIVRQTRADALIVPRKAVIRELQHAHVFVVHDDVAEKRNVELGLEESGQLEVVRGLELGDRIVIAGQGGLKDGSAIRVLTEPEIQAANPADSKLDQG